MGYSKVIDPVVKIKRTNLVPLITGEGVVQELGYVERKMYRYFWITSAELQAEVDSIQTTEAEDGWVIEGEPARVPVHNVIVDLFNVEIILYRFVSE